MAWAAPWRSVKQRACSNIWQVSALTPGKHKQLHALHVLKHHLFHNVRLQNTLPCWDHSFQACRNSVLCSPPETVLNVKQMYIQNFHSENVIYPTNEINLLVPLECSVNRCFKSLRARVRFSSRCCRWRFSSFRVWMVSWSSYAELRCESKEINHKTVVTCKIENIVV